MIINCLSGLSSVRAEPWQDLFQVAKFENAECKSIPYRLLKPEAVEPGKKYPLVLFLHGIGERGSNNSRQLTHGVGDFARPENRWKHPCFVVAPQCPLDDSWTPLSSLFLWQVMRDEPTAALKIVLELVDRLTADLPVDTHRVYITGLSMGGFGVWEAIARRPDLFAAAMPICGGGDAAGAVKFKDLPLWAFHGSIDITVPATRTTAMIDAMHRAGGKPRVTIFPAVGHICWTRVYPDPEVMDWLFAQKR
jgi:predicted peptidase